MTTPISDYITNLISEHKDQYLFNQRRTYQRTKNLIYERGGPWEEFENFFEEGWADNPTVPTLANIKHHHIVANLAANMLARVYKSQDELWHAPGGDDIACYAYIQAAKDLFPGDTIHFGDTEGQYNYWKESYELKPDCPHTKEFYNDQRIEKGEEPII